MLSCSGKLKEKGKQRAETGTQAAWPFSKQLKGLLSPESLGLFEEYGACVSYLLTQMK